MYDERKLLEFRKQKDRHWKHDKESPLTKEQKKNFKGLNYFRPNQKLHFVLQLNTNIPDVGSRVIIKTTDGDKQAYVKAGKVSFSVEGKEVEAVVFEDPEQEQYQYYLLFRDETTGKETYKNGRMLQVDPSTRSARSGQVKLVVDFNYAYNPYSSYNDNWGCPITPKENILAVRIEAGEKKEVLRYIDMYGIDDYFLIGDLHSAALVSKGGSIDWLCLPHFDSPSLFAKLLDPKGGSFSLISKRYSTQTKYVKNTAIVEHKFEKNNSSFTLHDFMVPQPTSICDTHFLVRKLRGKRGTSHITLYFEPKANYAKEIFKEDKKLEKLLPKVPESFGITPAVILRTKKETLILYLPSSAHVEYRNKQYEIHLTLFEGETQSIVMKYASGMQNEIIRNRELEKETVSFWKKWVAKGTFFDFCRDELIRSAITLKLMQFYPTGALVAAPTTSLPEEIGGVRNWDYRYVWIRDATFTLYAFYVLGYMEEAEKFFEFIQSIVKKCSKDNFDVSLFYTIEGKPVPSEQTLEHLKGYKDSIPVRIGNGAKEQFQLDVYGALVDVHYFVSKRKMEVKELHKNLILRLAQKIEELWMKKDNGIWEVRSGAKHFTYSKVMAWVGINRVLRMKTLLSLNSKQVRHYKKLEKQISDWIWSNCYDPNLKTFQQYPGAYLQDATNFLFVLLQFLDKNDPKTKTIIEKTCEELCVQDIFVYRYLSDDGLPRGEGAFLLCTFWFISSLAIIEDVDRAEQLFNIFEKKMVPHYLLSEEMDVRTGFYLGNYPQAFSHLGLIMAAYYIHKYKKKSKR